MAEKSTIEKPAKLKSSFGACAFIDILGHSEKLLLEQSNGNLDSMDELVSEFQESIVNAVRDMPRLVENTSFNFQMISDSAFLYVTRDVNVEHPKDGSDREMIVYLSMILSMIQFNLHSSGIPTRGGLSCGHMIARDNIVVGLPVIHAVQLEKSVSKFPIISLCCESEALVRNYLTNDNESIPVLKKMAIDSMLFRFKDDGIMFINPFSTIKIIENITEPDILDASLSVLHTRLRYSLSCYQQNEDIYPKYQFLKDLWNYCVNRKMITSKYIFVSPGRDKPYSFYAISEFLQPIVDHAEKIASKDFPF
ncbi:MAG: hypothetical protein KF824_04025 [Fimbriimonadaceae bacterium]|nr:MAG: hypothetical protein KF824_04025 [Fimbriimonadaceae bacterium]